MRAHLASFEPLKPGEAAYCESVATGRVDAHGRFLVGDGKLPEPGDSSRTIRAAVVEYLARSGPPGRSGASTGLRLAGATIVGDVALTGARQMPDLELACCRFEGVLQLRGAELRLLDLEDAHLRRIEADRLEAPGGVLMRNAKVEGEARFLGARIGGDFSAAGAHFLLPTGFALNADRIDVRGDLSLNGAVVDGEARLVGARVGGDLACLGTIFKGRELAPAESGTAAPAAGDRPVRIALNLDRAEVAGAFFLRARDAEHPAEVHGVLDLTGARLSMIGDDKGAWPQQPHTLRLDRCRYDGFIGKGAPTDARTRLKWLALHDPTRLGADFHPQPYMQLAAVLRDTGHAEGARRVLIRKERLQRRAQRRAAWRRAPVEALARTLWDCILAWTIDYGLRPLKALWGMLFLFLAGWAIFATAERLDAVKPNNPFILRSAEWAFCAHPDKQIVVDASKNPTGVGRAQSPNGELESQLDCFQRQDESASFPRFSALAYSADTLFPLVDLEMQDNWIPDETAAEPWGGRIRAYLWVQIALGWFLSLLAVAGLSGLVRSDK